jgi:nucleoside-diphosphate-sugar epimerase
MRYIVTGGAGFIGSHIADRLALEGKEVIVIDNLSTGKQENISANVKFVKGDILDKELVKNVINQGDIIFHQAALPSVARSVENPFLTNRVNVEGTLNILLAARDKNARRLIFASSSSIYGDSQSLPKVESMSPSPKSPYALSKLTAEYYVNMFYRLYGLEAISLRYFNVFGPRQDPGSEYSAVIPKFIKMMKEGKPPIIYGDGTQTRDFTFVSNVVDANLLASATTAGLGETINIACNERHSLIDLVNSINKLLGISIKPLFQRERQGDVKHSQADINKSKCINYSPKIRFLEGLKITMESM